MLFTFSKWCSKSSAFFFHFSCKHQKVTSCAAQIPSFLSQLCVLSGRGTVSSLGRLLVCVPSNISRIFADLIKYLVKFGSFHLEHCLSQLLLQDWESVGWIHSLIISERQETEKKAFRKAEKAAMEARRRGKSMQERVLDSVFLDNSGSKEHTGVLKTRQWLDRSSWNSLWMRLNDLSCWQTVGMVAGLTLAGVIGLFHAWFVYSIHENLLWFSQLEVRRTTLKIYVQFCRSLGVKFG